MNEPTIYFATIDPKRLFTLLGVKEPRMFYAHIVRHHPGGGLRLVVEWRDWQGVKAAWVPWEDAVDCMVTPELARELAALDEARRIEAEAVAEVAAL